MAMVVTPSAFSVDHLLPPASILTFTIAATGTCPMSMSIEAAFPPAEQPVHSVAWAPPDARSRPKAATRLRRIRRYLHLDDAVRIPHGLAALDAVDMFHARCHCPPHGVF